MWLWGGSVSLNCVHNLLAPCLAWGSFVGMGPPPLVAFDLTTALWCVTLAYQHYLKHVKRELFCLPIQGAGGDVQGDVCQHSACLPHSAAWQELPMPRRASRARWIVWFSLHCCCAPGASVTETHLSPLATPAESQRASPSPLSGGAVCFLLHCITVQPWHHSPVSISLTVNNIPGTLR